MNKLIHCTELLISSIEIFCLFIYFSMCLQAFVKKVLENELVVCFENRLEICCKLCKTIVLWLGFLVI